LIVGIPFSDLYPIWSFPGKVGVPDSILLKADKLTPGEVERVKRHVLLGGEALTAAETHFKGRSSLALGKEIAFYHHEKWDGSG